MSECATFQLRLSLSPLVERVLAAAGVAGVAADEMACIRRSAVLIPDLDQLAEGFVPEASALSSPESAIAAGDAALARLRSRPLVMAALPSGAGEELASCEQAVVDARSLLAQGHPAAARAVAAAAEDRICQEALQSLSALDRGRHEVCLEEVIRALTADAFSVQVAREENAAGLSATRGEETVVLTLVDTELRLDIAGSQGAGCTGIAQGFVSRLGAAGVLARRSSSELHMRPEGGTLMAESASSAVEKPESLEQAALRRALRLAKVYSVGARQSQRSGRLVRANKVNA